MQCNKYNVECACKVLSDDECPIERSNAERRATALAAKSRSNSPCPIPSAAVPPPPPSIPKNKQKNAGVNLLPRGKYAPKKSRIKEAPAAATENKLPAKKKDEEETTTKKQKPKFKLGFKIKLKEKKKADNKKEVEESSPTEKSSQAKKKAAITEKKTPNRKRQNSTLKSEESFTSPPVKKDKISEENGDDNEHDAREEKKMRQLLEQIARMEEREKRKKTTPKSRSNSSCEEKISKFKEFSSPKKEIKVESSFSIKTERENATSTTAPLRSDSVSSSANIYTDTESYVAKKRWLRQALSEGISSRTSSDENQTGQSVAGLSSPIFNMMSPNSNDRQHLQHHPSISENIFESNRPCSIINTTNSSEIETELITTSINVTLEECVLSDLTCAGALDSRPSSSADSSTPLQTESEQFDQLPKKKVRMSLDEYKKRKRDVPGESSGGPETTPTQQAVNVSGGDLYTQPIRLGSLPDPRLIGRGSTSLEDLRKRIYGRTFNYANNQTDGATERFAKMFFWQ
uniref:Uncharacterized protein n=1 Tax=Romanomermis culicivorax TaxID=13658 RepID=A0A915J494_ROMCU